MHSKSRNGLAKIQAVIFSLRKSILDPNFYHRLYLTSRRVDTANFCAQADFFFFFWKSYDENKMTRDLPCIRRTYTAARGCGHAPTFGVFTDTSLVTVLLALA
jgi:hypothetical protein